MAAARCTVCLSSVPAPLMSVGGTHHADTKVPGRGAQPHSVGSITQKTESVMSSENSDWQDDLPLDAQQRREAFARYGVAMYYAQCLEHQLGLMLASMCNHGFLDTPHEARDTLFDEELSKTLGRMVQGFKKAMPVSPRLEDRLTRAVEVRNWLAHKYFRERAREILSVRGREVMISELQEHADFFQVLDSEFTGMMETWLSRMGVSGEDIRAEMQRFRDETTDPARH